jgi:hypothetical protein
MLKPEGNQVPGKASIRSAGTTVTTIRIPTLIRERASAYADALGISLNALIAVALKDYLDARQHLDRSASAGQDMALSSPPASSVTVPAESRQQRRARERAEARGKPIL